MTHICVSKLTIIGSDNGLSPDRRQAIIWTNAGLFLNGPLGTNFSEILIEILTFSFKKMRLKVPSAQRRPFCLGLNVLTVSILLHRKNHLEKCKIYLDFLNTYICVPDDCWAPNCHRLLKVTHREYRNSMYYTIDITASGERWGAKANISMILT